MVDFGQWRVEATIRRRKWQRNNEYSVIKKAWDSTQTKGRYDPCDKNDLKVLNEERQAKLDDLKRINKKLRQSERRRMRMRLDEEKGEHQVELKRRAYNKQVQKLDKQRRKHAQQ